MAWPEEPRGLPSLPPTRIVQRKELKLWPRAELQSYYDKIGRIYGPERLDDVRVVEMAGDDVWIEITTSRLVGA